MLHIIKSQQALQQALPIIQTNDDILLLEEAVYALIVQNDANQSLKDHQDHCWLLEQDIVARGLSGLVDDSFQVADFKCFVSLTEKHAQSMTWD